MKKILEEIETITFTKHIHEKLKQRSNITKEEIEENLKDSHKLIDAEHQGKEFKKDKYSLLFSKSNKYDLRVVVSVKDKSLNVITAHIQNIKRRKVYEKWLKRQKKKR